jgi:SPP1 gp7 family putative phage head morphogenesis protein
MNYTDSQIEDLIKAVYEGRTTVQNLPLDLYLAIGKNLEDGIREGWGALMDSGIGSPDVPLYNALRENVYIFSAAKTYQQVKDMAEFIAESTSYTNFKVKAMETYGEYNTDWLKAEYNTAVGQAQQANQWQRIQQSKDVFPYLRYSAVIDSKTSEICRPLDGVTLPVDDPFWDNYAPLNHFNCRCTLEKIDKYEDVTVTREGKVAEITKELNETVKPEFKMNSGKDGYIFDPKSHPYFKVAPKDKGLARNNFNLPIPPPITPAVVTTTETQTIEKRLEDVKKASKELHEIGAGKTYKDAKKAYKEAVAALDPLYDEGNKLAKTLPFDHPDRIANREKLAEASATRRRLLAEQNDARLKYEPEVAKILKSRNAPSKFSLTASRDQLKKMTHLKDGQTYFREIVGDKVMGENIAIGVKGLAPTGRAYFQGGSINKIHITLAEGAETVAHELGHGLEYHNPDYFKKIKSYYEERTKGYSLERMRDITGNKGYRVTEVTKRDKFTNAYTGKWYANSKGDQVASEITSMWFTEAFKDLEAFIDNDYDYFSHIYKLFNE